MHGVWGSSEMNNTQGWRSDYISKYTAFYSSANQTARFFDYFCMHKCKYNLRKADVKTGGGSWQVFI